jgi:hypothetical protein
MEDAVMETATAVDEARMIACTSRAADPRAAVAELAECIDGRKLAGALLFCSNAYPRDSLQTELAQAMPDVRLFGCTSAGELNDQGYDTHSVVLIGFPEGPFAMTSLRFDDLDHFDPQAAQGAIRQLVAQSRREHGEGLHQVALFFVDGLSHREELLTMTAQHALGDIQLIGGSSGDGLSFRDTAIFHEGAFHKDAAVIVLLTSRRPLHVFCKSFYRPGPAKMVITRRMLNLGSSPRSMPPPPPRNTAALPEVRRPNSTPSSLPPILPLCAPAASSTSGRSRRPMTMAR